VRTIALLVLAGLALACTGKVSGTGDEAPSDGSGSDPGVPPVVPPVIPPDPPPVDTRPSSARLLARPLGSTDAPSGFYEYLPPDYPDGKARPLLVFWHGIGENGDGAGQLPKVLANGPPKLIAADRWPGTRPFLVLSPQHPGGGCPSAAEVHAFLAWAAGTYDVDPQRVFLTGLSCGAIGSWSYLAAYAGSEVSAALLLAGDPGDPAASWSAWGRQGCDLGDLAIWAVHGDADGVVAIGNERATMADLAGCPSPPARDSVWTEVAGAGHDVWSAVYDGSFGHDVYAWLLEHPRS
jgi:predicted peptidase